jgi:hypothetical protein
MSKELKRWKSKIINECLALHHKHGDGAVPIVKAVMEWSEEHPLTGDDARLPPFFKQNADYGSGEGILGQLDAYRKKAKRKLKRKVYDSYAKDGAVGSFGPIDSYCGSERNKKYWKGAGSSQAVRDFLQYIDQVECS